ncbi:MAG: metallophosphoesterase [Sodaliphilus sp.]
MNLHWTPLLIAIVIHLVIDIAVYRKLKHKKVLPQWVAPSYAVLSLALYVALGFAVAFVRHPSDALFRLSMCLFLAFYGIQGPKMVAFLIYCLSYVKCFSPRAKRVVRRIAGATFVALVGVVAWASFITPYTIEVKHITISSPNLPAAFDGYRIVQFSDAHVGTYGTDTSFVSQYVDTINAQHPDLICFTGDMVNRHAAEAAPFVKPFSRLHAPDGVVAIQGNHDYKEYYPWSSARHWQSDSLRLIRLQRNMGFTVCHDSAFSIRRQADSIVVVGLRNFLPPHWKIPQNLRRVYPQVQETGIYKILLQHVPYVWKNYTDSAHIDLTLSGHTHAMQTAITISGHTLSPACLLHQYWGGYYRDGDEVLYVNSGVGEVGMLMRIGVKPEITVITLKKTNH